MHVLVRGLVTQSKFQENHFGNVGIFVSYGHVACCCKKWNKTSNLAKSIGGVSVHISIRHGKQNECYSEIKLEVLILRGALCGKSIHVDDLKNCKYFDNVKKGVRIFLVISTDNSNVNKR